MDIALVLEQIGDAKELVQGVIELGRPDPAAANGSRPKGAVENPESRLKTQE
jgi:hypothetical protein